MERLGGYSPLDAVGDAVVVEQMALADEDEDQTIGILLDGLVEPIGHGFVPQDLRFKKTIEALAIAFALMHFAVNRLNPIAVGIRSQLNRPDRGNEATIGEIQTFESLTADFSSDFAGGIEGDQGKLLLFCKLDDRGVERPRKSPPFFVFTIFDELRFGYFALEVILQNALVRTLKLFKGDGEMGATLVEFLNDFELKLVVFSAVVGFAEINNLLFRERLKKQIPLEDFPLRSSN